MMQREKSSVCVAGVTEMWLSHFLDGIWVNHVAWCLFQNTIHQGCILEQTKERNQAGNMINPDLSEKWLLQACVCDSTVSWRWQIQTQYRYQIISKSPLANH